MKWFLYNSLNGTKKVRKKQVSKLIYSEWHLNRK